MNEMAQYALEEIFATSVPGEWGSGPERGENALVIRAADFTKDCKLSLNMGAPRYIPVRKLQTKQLKNGDILIEKSGGSPEQPVGRVVYFDRGHDSTRYIHSNFLQLLRTNERFESKFCYYLMSQLYASGRVLRYQQQTTGIINLKLESYLKEKVCLPSLIYQKKIAHILKAVDQTIEHTTTLIDKHQQIQAGLMHDLFTRGIGTDGQLRPSREQEPELYHQTPIGWIPKEWSAAPLVSICDLLVGYAFKSAWFQHEGVRLLRGENVGYGIADWSDSKFLSPNRAASYSEYLLKEHDTIIGMDRTFTKSGVKISALSKEDCPCLLVQRVGKFSAKLDNSSFVRWLLLSQGYLRQLVNQQKGMDIPHLSRSEILAPIVPVPSKAEQLMTSKMLNAAEARINRENEALEKLHRIKFGMMHDLLTGKIPVTVNVDTKENADVQN